VVQRIRVDLDEIAAFDNLAESCLRAARGKRRRPEVIAFLDDIEANLSALGEAMRAGCAPTGRYHVFRIHDPKPRTIHAPCFADRIVHHALIGAIGPRLARALVPSCFACRTGMGNLAAVRAAQRASRRFAWVVHLDIKAYFDSIDHRILIGLLDRLVKGRDLLPLIERILASHQSRAGKGLPIGALTSQYFANLYLSGFDRFLLEEVGVRAHVRYMDDSLWWVDDKDQARDTLRAARAWLSTHRFLEVKEPGIVGASRRGVTFCGYRIYPRTLRLTRRKRRRYVAGLVRWERRYRRGEISANGLQAGVASVLAPTLHADARAWRRARHCLVPPMEVS